MEDSKQKKEQEKGVMAFFLWFTVRNIGCFRLRFSLLFRRTHVGNRDGVLVRKTWQMKENEESQKVVIRKK